MGLSQGEKVHIRGSEYNLQRRRQGFRLMGSKYFCTHFPQPRSWIANLLKLKLQTLHSFTHFIQYKRNSLDKCIYHLCQRHFFLLLAAKVLRVFQIFDLPSKKLMGSRTPLKKLMGSAEPIEPMLTAPLFKITNIEYH